jgi:RNA polymerase sigma factor (sigma-70 family)
MTSSVPEEVRNMDESRPTRREVAVEATRDEYLDALFRQHYLALLRLAVVMVGSREVAEDVVQDAFVALHKNWRSVRDPQTAAAYLRSTLLNRCRSWMRRQVTQRSVRPLIVLRPEQQSAEDTTLLREEVGSMVALLRTLARRQREVLACRFVLELSVAETARLLEISEGSVKAHTHRGLEALQQRIEVAR